MLGPAKPRRRDAPIAVSLEALVPQDTFYRHLEAKLYLAFTVYFDSDEASVNHGIFGPEFTFTGEMIAGKITIGKPIGLAVQDDT